MRSLYLKYLLSLITDDKERAKFQRDPDKAMTDARLNPYEQHALISLALVNMDPQDIGAAVLKVLDDDFAKKHRGGGGGPGHGPP